MAIGGWLGRRPASSRVAPVPMSSRSSSIQSSSPSGRVPNDQLWKQLSARKDEWAKNDIQAIYQAGDCYAPGLIAQAVFEGHRIAREFESSNPQRPQPWIRERQVWGHETYSKDLGSRSDWLTVLPVVPRIAQAAGPAGILFEVEKSRRNGHLFCQRRLRLIPET